MGALLQSGHDVIAVDIAQAALDALQSSLDESARSLAADRLSLVVADVRSFRRGGQLVEPVDVWHDRAVFHFFVEATDRSAYADAAAETVSSGGHLVIATFAPSGPTSCSGLPVTRHDASSLSSVFAPAFVLVDSFEADHHTPWGAVQRFTHAVLRRI